MKSLTNLEISQLLRKVAAACQILNENRFKIIAYERVADSIEQLTGDVIKLWENNTLDQIPGVGQGIASDLNELLTTGKVAHFNETMKKVPAAVFPLLLVSGIGPKKAYKLVKELKIKDDEDDVIGELEFLAKAHLVAPIEGFGEKSELDILEAISTYRRGEIKENRMELSVADSIAGDIIDHLKKLGVVERIDILGSLRRRAATIGDIDIAVATKKPEDVIAHFVTFPHQKIIEQGPTGASLLLHNGRQVDVRVQKPEAYGAMLQYFTGSKKHNIKLRSYGLTKGKSLNEYGIKVINKSKVESQKVIKYESEEKFYNTLGLPWIPPELREDKGEIEAAIAGKLPKLVEVGDINGDLHLHTNYDLKPSHDLGTDPLELYLDRAVKLGYKYIGLSDHNPKTSDLTNWQIVEIMKRRKEFYEQHLTSWLKKVPSVGIFVMCEVDIQPGGKLALPEGAFEFVDAVIVSIHSSFAQSREEMTRRIVSSLTAHPKVRIFGHPTGRLLTKREGIELDWDEIFSVCKDRNITLEINANPMRLDLPDTIVFDAVKNGIKLCINTDSHAVYEMDLMKYGVSVARRGWCQKIDIVNTMGYAEIRNWLFGK